jgi:hypothetical protein
MPTKLPRDVSVRELLDLRKSFGVNVSAQEARKMGPLSRIARAADKAAAAAALAQFEVLSKRLDDRKEHHAYIQARLTDIEATLTEASELAKPVWDGRVTPSNFIKLSI